MFTFIPGKWKKTNWVISPLHSWEWSFWQLHSKWLLSAPVQPVPRELFFSPTHLLSPFSGNTGHLMSHVTQPQRWMKQICRMRPISPPGNISSADTSLSLADVEFTARVTACTQSCASDCEWIESTLPTRGDEFGDQQCNWLCDFCQNLFFFFLKKGETAVQWNFSSFPVKFKHC